MNQTVTMAPATRAAIETASRRTGNLEWKIIGALFIVGMAWRALFIYQDIAWLTDYWLFEDFGYSLKIAMQIAAGHGETFDGVVATNGYQPLYVWLMVPVFWLTKSLTAPVYAAITLLALCNAATIVPIHAIVRRLTHGPYWALAAAAFWTFNFAIVKDGSNGLESGLSTLLIAIAVAYFLKASQERLSGLSALLIGLFAGLAFLGRIDAVFTAGAMFIVILADRTLPLGARLGRLLAAMAGFLLLAAPYAAWNLRHFGSPLPTSGQVTTGKASMFDLPNLLSPDLWDHIASGFFIVSRLLAGDPAVNGYVEGGGEGILFGAKLLVATLLAMFAVLWLGRRALPKRARQGVLLLSLIALFYMYGYTIHSFVPFERYFLPVALALLMIGCAACGVLFDRLGRRGTVPAPLVLSALASAHFLVTGLAYLDGPMPKSFGWYAGARVLNSISAPGDVVAASQTGNTGYFYTKGRAVNLDGVVNMDAYRARKNLAIDQYMRSEHVRFIADERDWVFKMGDYIGNADRRAQWLASLRLRYESERSRYAIFEIMPRDYKAIRKLQGPGWQVLPVKDLIGGAGSMAAQPGARIDFAAHGCAELKMLKHPWSGIAAIYRDGVLLQQVDLYAAISDPTFRLALAEDGGAHTYSVVATGKKNPQSQGSEVWIDALLEAADCIAPAPRPETRGDNNRNARSG